jgi:hypothetical protein
MNNSDQIKKAIMVLFDHETASAILPFGDQLLLRAKSGYGEIALVQEIGRLHAQGNVNLDQPEACEALARAIIHLVGERP